MTAYLVWCPDRGRPSLGPFPVRRIVAPGPREAAEEWARSDDARGDYSIVRGDAVEVCVQEILASEVRAPKTSVWRVTGESEPVYTARHQRVLP